ncbi:MAG: MFS transporter [Proteobacteria bacterium]|nr:MFS transporter [Pseudomonadota bacterium]MBS0573403.1 MFS transporter [Pseudomonadota bacterium]
MAITGYPSRPRPIIEQRPTFSPLRNPAYRSLWAAIMVSNLGGLIQTVGAGWLMTSLTPSQDMIALVQSSNTLPIMALSMIGGALADSYDRRRLMIGAQMFMVVVSAALALAAWQGQLTPWMLLGFTFLIGAGTALNNPAWQASVGDIVGRADLPAAVSLNSMGFNLMRSVGPALGGLIVAAFGAAAAFGVNALSYLPLVGALVRWRPASAGGPRLPREPLGAALGAGLRYVAMSPGLMRVVARAGLFGLAASSVLALLPIVARNLLGGTALTYGILLGAFGIGAIGGVALNPRVRAAHSNERVVRGAFLAFAVGALGLGLSRHLALSVLSLFVAGSAWVLALSLFNVSVQLSSPRWVVGRALSFYQTAVFGGMAGGSWLWGLLSEYYGATAAFAVSAGLLVVGAAAGRWLGLSEFAELDLDPLGQFREPELRFDLRSQSGPIKIMIDYVIAYEDIDEFLGAMQARRIVRVRDGARRWALLRDLENPELWTESYQVATWVEYLRHHERRTKADAGSYERLRALHRGPGDPRVHRMIERQTVPLRDDLGLKPPPGEG